MQEWITVKRILDEHDFPDKETGEKLLPNVDPDLMEESM